MRILPKFHRFGARPNFRMCLSRAACVIISVEMTRDFAMERLATLLALAFLGADCLASGTGRNVLFNSDYSADDGIGTPLGWERVDFKEDAFGLRRVAGGGVRLDFDARSKAGVFLEQRNLSLRTGAVYRVRGEMRSDCPPETRLRFVLHGSPWQTTACSDNLMTSTTGRWVRLDMTMTVPVVKDARKCAFGFNACNGKGSVEVRNLSLEPEDPSVAVVPYGRGLDLSPLPARIVPVDPLLSRMGIMARSCYEFDCRSELGKIRCPVLVMGGEKDRTIGAAGSRELAEYLGCECYIYPDYGHAVYDEAPDYKDRMLRFFHAAEN